MQQDKGVMSQNAYYQFNPSAMNSYGTFQQEHFQNKNKENELLERIKPLEQVHTISEAKALMEKIMPTAKEYTSFYVGETKCSILNKEDVLRVCIETAEQFICYDFS